MYKIYCLSYNNLERRQSMTERFNKLELEYTFYDGVNFTDPRIHPDAYKKCWSIMYGHLDMLRMFIDDNYEYGIFCEDDIYLHQNFKLMMPTVINNFEFLKLDILLLGYLIPFKVEPWYEGFSLKSNDYLISSYKYHNYTNDVWGTQMYMLSRKSAQYMLNKYNDEFAINSITNEIIPFSADWTLTKDGNRALISPCLAVEDGKTDYKDDIGQKNYHLSCHHAHYDESLFI